MPLSVSRHFQSSSQHKHRTTQETKTPAEFHLRTPQCTPNSGTRASPTQDQWIQNKPRAIHLPEHNTEWVQHALLQNLQSLQCTNPSRPSRMCRRHGPPRSQAHAAHTRQQQFTILTKFKAYKTWRWESEKLRTCRTESISQAPGDGAAAGGRRHYREPAMEIASSRYICNDKSRIACGSESAAKQSPVHRHPCRAVEPRGAWSGR
jgi:hypothetical protein